MWDRGSAWLTNTNTHTHILVASSLCVRPLPVYPSCLCFIRLCEKCTIFCSLLGCHRVEMSLIKQQQRGNDTTLLDKQELCFGGYSFLNRLMDLLIPRPGDHCGEGRQLQRAAQPALHQHQEPHDLPLCQPEGQGLPGPADLRLPAADHLEDLP